MWAVSHDAYESLSLEIDPENNIYSAGIFTGTVDFDPGAGSSLLSTLNPTGYVLKLDSNGHYIWANKFDGGRFYICNLKLDSEKNMYVLATYQGSADLDFGPAQYMVNSIGGGSATAIFVVKMDSMLNFNWGKNITGSEFNAGFTITTDQDLSVYCTGYFQNTVDFNPGAGISEHTSNGYSDAFLLKLDSAGYYQWSKSFGGSGTDMGHYLLDDQTGYVLLAAQLGSASTYDSMGFTKQTPFAGSSDNVLFQFNKNGDVLNTFHFGHSGYENVFSMDVNVNNDIICVGSYSDTIAFNGDTIIHSGSNDVLMYKVHLWPTAISEIEEMKDIMIYPNPANDHIRISKLPDANYTLEICDISGRILLTIKSNKTEQQINLDTMESALYFITIRSERSTYSSKILKL
jgi:hypothetical protein